MIKIYCWWELPKKSFDDNIARIIIWEDDLKDKKYPPFGVKSDKTREHKMLEFGYICEKGGDMHNYFKKKLGLKLKNRWEG